jgi:5-methylcytosine-specific restriction endonuclease McrA
MANRSTEHNITHAYFKMLVVSTMAKKRDIKCSLCGSHHNLELHHTSYKNPTIYDLEILCSVCHRNDFISTTGLETVYRDGHRYCHVSGYEFSY